MLEGNNQSSNIFNANDSLDINELASLNDDISPEFIEQLQNQVAQNASEFTGKPILSLKEDSELFEEVEGTSREEKPLPKLNLDSSFDDNFVKKYKAKLNKQQLAETATKEENSSETLKTNDNFEENVENEVTINRQNDKDKKTAESASISLSVSSVNNTTDTSKEIEKITSGNIIEKPATQEQIQYNESLDFVDDNVKYSKYVIYIDPENAEFIESLTVKERKNLINRILREQDDIAITKKRLGFIQTIIKHTVVAIITISVAIPIIYWTINASLEASINNYRRSQTIFKTLYKEKGKIKTQNKY